MIITKDGANLVSSLSGAEVKAIPEVVEADLPESEQLILKEHEIDVYQEIAEESEAYRTK